MLVVDPIRVHNRLAAWVSIIALAALGVGQPAIAAAVDPESSEQAAIAEAYPPNETSSHEAAAPDPELSEAPTEDTLPEIHADVPDTELELDPNIPANVEPDIALVPELDDESVIADSSMNDEDSDDPDSVIGRVVVVVSEDFDQPESSGAEDDVETLVFTGEEFLEVPPAASGELEHGDLVAVTLADDGALLDVEELAPEAVPSTTTAIGRAATAGTHRTVVVLLTPAGVPLPAGALANAQAIANNAGNYWVNQSVGKIPSFSTEQVINAAGSLSTCSTSSDSGGYASAYVNALQAYQPTGNWTNSNYKSLPWPDNTHIIAYVLGCGRTTSQGFGSIGGSNGNSSGLYGTGGGGISAIFVKDSDASLASSGVLHMTEHELGHNFGLWHANLLTCKSGGSDSPVNVPVRSGCAIQEYGDMYDVMGRSNTAFVGDLSAIAAESIGISVNPIREAPVKNNYEQTFTLSALSAKAGHRALVITDPISKEEYWIELRARGSAVIGNTGDNWWLDYYNNPPFTSVDYWFNSGLRVTKKVSNQGSPSVANQNPNSGTVVVLDREYSNTARAAFGIQRPGLDQRLTFTSITGGFTVEAVGLQIGNQTATIKITTPQAAVPKTITGGSVTVIGTPTVGSTLQAKTGEFTPAVTPKYQWLRDGKAIGGAAAKKSDYLLVAADAGKTISVQVTASKPAYETLTITSVGRGPVASNLITGGSAKVEGTIKVGSQLAAVTPTAFAPNDVKLSYQWLRDGTAIQTAAAKKQTYTLLAADAGKNISVQITAAKTGYNSVPKTSAQRGPVQLGKITSGSVGIDGTNTVGSTLTATPPVYSVDGVKLSYQWLRDGTPIPGTAAKTQKQTYTLVAADKGTKIAVRVTATKAGYTELVKTSAVRNIK